MSLIQALRQNLTSSCSWASWPFISVSITSQVDVVLLCSGDIQLRHWIGIVKKVCDPRKAYLSFEHRLQSFSSIRGHSRHYCRKSKVSGATVKVKITNERVMKERARKGVKKQKSIVPSSVSPGRFSAVPFIRRCTGMPSCNLPRQLRTPQNRLPLSTCFLLHSACLWRATEYWLLSLDTSL